MSTSFVDLIPPQGPAAHEALAKLLSNDIPPPTLKPHATFIDALLVRKYVFVDEQQCTLANEVDADDARAYHWVVHASISASTKTHDGENSDVYVRRKSAGGRIPVGTVRMVPPPHPPHPAPGSIDGVGGDEVTGRVLGGDVPTALHDGNEPYVKIGRLATVKEYRGMGLGRLLLNEALQWAVSNRDKLQSLPDNPIERERIDEERKQWRGLVMAHAQTTAVSFYESMGFELDKKLGHWVEEGIDHVAMWRRLKLEER